MDARTPEQGQIWQHRSDDAVRLYLVAPAQRGWVFGLLSAGPDGPTGRALPVENLQAFWDLVTPPRLPVGWDRVGDDGYLFQEPEGFTRDSITINVYEDGMIGVLSTASRDVGVGTLVQVSDMITVLEIVRDRGGEHGSDH